MSHFWMTIRTKTHTHIFYTAWNKHKHAFGCWKWANWCEAEAYAEKWKEKSNKQTRQWAKSSLGQRTEPMTAQMSPNRFLKWTVEIRGHLLNTQRSSSHHTQRISDHCLKALHLFVFSLSVWLTASLSHCLSPSSFENSPSHMASGLCEQPPEGVWGWTAMKISWILRVQQTRH